MTSSRSRSIKQHDGSYGRRLLWTGAHEVDNVTVSDVIAVVCHSFHSAQDAVRLFVHDSAPYMTKVVQRFQKKKKRYKN